MFYRLSKWIQQCFTCCPNESNNVLQAVQMNQTMFYRLSKWIKHCCTGCPNESNNVLQAVQMNPTMFYRLSKWIQQCFTGCPNESNIVHQKSGTKEMFFDVWQKPNMFYKQFVGWCFMAMFYSFGQAVRWCAELHPPLNLLMAIKSCEDIVCAVVQGCRI